MKDSKNFSQEKNYNISFFYEKNMRSFLSRFYHSIVQSGENAKEFLDVDLDEFVPKKIAGDSDTKSSMKDVFNKLEYVRIFLKSDQIFETQIMEPIKIASDLRLQYTSFKGGKRSSNVKGLVFARSRQYEKDYGNTATLSLICPDLQSVMSMRVAKDCITENNEWLEFEKVQPIVLVNRLHPTPGSKTKINTLEKKKDLFEFDFIFSSIGDLHEFSRSLEVENFSEISSSQSDKQRHLGYTFVSFGRVTSFDEQDISIESLLNGKEIELSIAHRNFKKNLPDQSLEDIVGKTVAFLGTMWYKTRGKDDIRMEFPELFYLQICNDDFLATVSEVIGYVRTRRKCYTSILKKDLKIDDKKFEAICSHLEKSSSVKFIENETSSELLFETKDVADPISLAYVKSLESIKRLREIARTSDAIQVTQETLVDKNKTNTEGMIRQLYFDCRVHGKIGCKIRLGILKEVGSYAEKYSESISIDRLLEMFNDKFHPVEIIRSQIWFLKNIVEFIDKKNKKVFLTNDGRKILAQIREKESERFLNSVGNIVELLKVPEYIHIPTLLKLLENPRNRFSPSKIDKISTKIFWAKTNVEKTIIKSDRIENYKKICREIISLMSKKSHALNSEIISELLTLREFEIKRPILELFLEDIKKTGRIKEEEGFYELLIEARIYEFFERNKDQILTVIEVLENIGIAKIDTNSTSVDVRKNRVQKILEAFVKTGTLVQVNSEDVKKWTWGVNLSKEQREFKNIRITEAEELRYTIRSEAFSMLKQCRAMKLNELEDSIDEIVCGLEFSVSEIERKNKISETLSEMIAHEEMYSDGYTVKYLGTSR
jgi:hypothetical protein